MAACSSFSATALAAPATARSSAASHAEPPRPSLVPLLGVLTSPLPSSGGNGDGKDTASGRSAVAAASTTSVLARCACVLEAFAVCFFGCVRGAFAAVDVLGLFGDSSAVGAVEVVAADWEAACAEEATTDASPIRPSAPPAKRLASPCNNPEEVAVNTPAAAVAAAVTIDAPTAVRTSWEDRSACCWRWRSSSSLRARSMSRRTLT